MNERMLQKIFLHEIEFFTAWHLDYFLTIPQVDKGWWDWNALAGAVIGLAQVIAGVALLTLIAVAEAQFGDALIAEGINNNMLYGTVAGLTGTFSWKDWSMQKVICVALSIATGGLGALASIDKATMKIGSASRYSTFTKTTAKVAGEFALGTVRVIMSHMDLVDMQQRVVTAIVSVIEEALFTKVNGPLHSKLVALAAQESNPDTFHARCQEIKHKIHLTHGSLLPQVFDQLHSQVVLSLNDTYNKYTARYACVISPIGKKKWKMN